MRAFGGLWAVSSGRMLCVSRRCRGWLRQKLLSDIVTVCRLWEVVALMTRVVSADPLAFRRLETLSMCVLRVSVLLSMWVVKLLGKLAVGVGRVVGGTG